MAAERPILASFDKDSQLSELIERVGCGVVAEADNEDEFIDAIIKIRENLSVGKLGRKYLIKELSKTECVKRYADTLKAALKDSESKENTK